MSSISIATVLQIPEKRAAYWLALIEAWDEMKDHSDLAAQFEAGSFEYEMCQQLERHRKAFLEQNSRTA